MIASPLQPTAQRLAGVCASAQPEAPQFQALLTIVDVVSFDLFDTLVQRDGLFSPKDLFYQVQALAEQQLGLDLGNFPAMRVHAEERARVHAWGRGLHETTLGDIYAELGRMLRLDAGTLQSLQQLELACERSAISAVDSGRRLFQAALAAGKTVLIVSDTYLGEDFIGEIVRQHGYGAAHRLYVSSTYGKSKVEGSLYDLVLSDLACPPARLLHVGDNPLADITMALGRGIRAFFAPTARQHLKWRAGLSDQPSGNLVMSAMLCDLGQRSQHSAGDSRSVIAQTATQHLAPLFFGYATWLLERLRGAGYQRVYFAARDGLIMKRFFDLVAATAGVAIESRYLYISRAALYPSLIFSDPPMARRLFAHNWDHLTIEQALRRISLTYEDCADLLAKHRLARRTLQLSRAIAERFAAFLADAWPLLEQKFADHYRLTVDYLRQEMIFDEEKVAFVDIGWHGSLQNCLLKLCRHLGLAKDLSGYYLGTFQQPIGAAAGFRSTGYLVDGDAPQSIAQLVRAGASVIELFHSAGHGGVLGYRRNGSQVEPVLQNSPEEQQQFVSMIEPMQNLAFEFVADHLARRPHAALQAPEPGLVARTALRVIYAPTAAEALTFGSLQIASDFGGRMKSITGTLEWDIRKIKGDLLPDHTLPIWRPGFQVLREL